MYRLSVKATGCKHKENDRRLKEKVINGINNEFVTSEIIKEVTVIKTPVKSLETQ